MRERCGAWRRDSAKVTGEEIATLQPQIPEGQLTETDGVKRLARAFRFRNFADALDFTAKVGEIAEAEGHHPRLTVEWGRVGVEWWTHAIRGLHRNAFIMSSTADESYAPSTESAYQRGTTAH